MEIGVNYFTLIGRKLEKFLRRLPLLKSDSFYLLIINFCLLFVYLLNVWAISIHLSQNSTYGWAEEYNEFREFSLNIMKIGCLAGLFDAFVILNTPYYSKGVFIQERSHIVKHYFRRNFVLDMFSIGPLMISIYHTSYHVIWHLFFVFFIFKIRKIVAQIEDHFHLQEKTQAVFNLLKLLTQIMAFAHFFACFWNFLASWEINSLQSPNSWMQVIHIENTSWDVKYINSLYYSIVTMVTVGYGDICPQNHIEKGFSIIIIVISCGFFAYALNSVGQILIEMNRNENKIK